MTFTDQQTVYRLVSSDSDSTRTLTSSLEPTHSPTRWEVLLSIKAVSLNYRDRAIQDGTYPFPVTDNVIPISDCSAVVISVGEGVSDLKEGDKVVVAFDGTNQFGPQRNWDHGHGGPVDGFLREYAVVPAGMCVKIPDGATQTWAELASMVCTGVTAWNALFGPVKIKPGQTILVQGTGGVSMTVLILAKAFGCTVIVTSSSDAKLALVQSKYGADHTINYKTTPLWGRAAAALTRDGAGVDVVIENGGSETIAQSFEAVKMGGLIAVIGFLSAAKQEEMPDVASLVLAKGAIVRGITVGSKQFLEELVQFMTERDLKVPVDRVFKFDEVEEAFEYLKSGSHVGKVCIEI